MRKSILTPSHTIEHLGYVLNSIHLSVGLPEEKRNHAFKFSWEILTKTSQLKIREVASLIGCYNAYAQATKWGRLYIRNLEREKISALHRCQDDYEKVMSISQLAKSDIRWWMSQDVFIPKPMFVDRPVLKIFSDASSLGWGAHTSLDSTGGRWSSAESVNHINWLELKACFLGLQCFARDLSHSTVQVFVDNTVALSYVNGQGDQSVN